jgi:hydrogenase maturation protease
LKQARKILLYGYGNPGRADDGLGPAFIEKVRHWINNHHIQYLSVDSNYQLNIEDAYSIRDYDIVIFADASVEDIEHYKLTRLQPAEKVNFTMHSVSPSYVLYLCREMYGHSPESFLLHIRGYSFEMHEGLSDAGMGNLKRAFEFMKSFLMEPDRLLNT